MGKQLELFEEKLPIWVNGEHQPNIPPILRA